MALQGIVCRQAAALLAAHHYLQKVHQGQTLQKEGFLPNDGKGANGVGEGAGVGLGEGLGVGLGVGVGAGDGVGVGMGVGLGEGAGAGAGVGAGAMMGTGVGAGAGAESRRRPSMTFRRRDGEPEAKVLLTAALARASLIWGMEAPAAGGRQTICKLITAGFRVENRQLQMPPDQESAVCVLLISNAPYHCLPRLSPRRPACSAGTAAPNPSPTTY